MALGAAAACALPVRRTLAQAAVPPSRTVTMAIVGYGARGRQMLPVFLGQPGVRFLAVCDFVECALHTSRKVEVHNVRTILFHIVANRLAEFGWNN